MPNQLLTEPQLAEGGFCVGSLKAVKAGEHRPRGLARPASGRAVDEARYFRPFLPLRAGPDFGDCFACEAAKETACPQPYAGDDYPERISKARFELRRQRVSLGQRSPSSGQRQFCFAAAVACLVPQMPPDQISKIPRRARNFRISSAASSGVWPTVLRRSSGSLGGS